MATGANDNGQSKGKILGQSRTLRDDEAENITQMIREAQQSSRQLTIPSEDLDAQATTEMLPEVAKVVEQSHVGEILSKFNRDYLYGLGRFDEYNHGLLLKWGDGYSRRHIWVTVEGENLIFQTSHERTCSHPYCVDGKHILTPQLWHDPRVINEELGEQFRRPVYERSDD
ncbi:MAG TPA: hypothetical protein VHI51_21965 [Ktedonobacterales bacterium]|jgi:hypothetical protein|nr:hypothetical protein [Ktedonobacterales bacterium]